MTVIGIDNLAMKTMSSQSLNYLHSNTLLVSTLWPICCFESPIGHLQKMTLFEIGFFQCFRKIKVIGCIEFITSLGLLKIAVQNLYRNLSANLPP